MAGESQGMWGTTRWYSQSFKHGGGLPTFYVRMRSLAVAHSSKLQPLPFLGQNFCIHSLSTNMLKVARSLHAQLQDPPTCRVHYLSSNWGDGEGNWALPYHLENTAGTIIQLLRVSDGDRGADLLWQAADICMRQRGDLQRSLQPRKQRFVGWLPFRKLQSTCAMMMLGTSK